MNFCLLPLLYAVQLIRLKNNQLIDKNPSQPQLIVRNNNVTQDQSKKASQLQSRKQRNFSENLRHHSIMINQGSPGIKSVLQTQSNGL